MNSIEFQELSIKEKGIVFMHGGYVAAQEYYNHRINLYSLDDFFVEVWYFPAENKITDIKAVTDDKILDLYIDRKLEFINQPPSKE